MNKQPLGKRYIEYAPILLPLCPIILCFGIAPLSRTVPHSPVDEGRRQEGEGRSVERVAYGARGVPAR
jgi:hypothetical protein